MKLSQILLLSSVSARWFPLGGSPEPKGIDSGSGSRGSWSPDSDVPHVYSGKKSGKKSHSGKSHSGKPHSGKPHSGRRPHSGRPHSGKPHSGKPHSGKHSEKPHSGEWDHNKDNMEEEYKEFKDMVGGDSNIMNVNFAPINNNAQNWININTQLGMEVDIGDDCDDCNRGKGHGHHGNNGHRDEDHDDEDDKDEHDEVGPKFDWENPMSWPEDMKYRVWMHMKKQIMSRLHEYAMHFHHELEPYYPLVKTLVSNMTGRDCEEWMAIFEEKFLQGNKITDISEALENGWISTTDIYMMVGHGMEQWGHKMENMTEDEWVECYNKMTTFLAGFGIDPKQIKDGFESWMGMTFEELKQEVEDIESQRSWGPYY